jgi:hypothetical protein
MKQTNTADHSESKQLASEDSAAERRATSQQPTIETASMGYGGSAGRSSGRQHFVLPDNIPPAASAEDEAEEKKPAAQLKKSFIHKQPRDSRGFRRSDY